MFDRIITTFRFGSKQQGRFEFLEMSQIGYMKRPSMLSISKYWMWIPPVLIVVASQPCKCKESKGSCGDFKTSVEFLPSPVWQLRLMIPVTRYNTTRQKSQTCQSPTVLVRNKMSTLKNRAYWLSAVRTTTQDIKQGMWLNSTSGPEGTLLSRRGPRTVFERKRNTRTHGRRGVIVVV